MPNLSVQQTGKVIDLTELNALFALPATDFRVRSLQQKLPI
jgi:hypothetical protein